jgi:DNA repair exonuclease SbcCD ATPase subunit
MPSPETRNDKTSILSGMESKQGVGVQIDQKQGDNKSSALKLPQLTAGERAEPRGFPANENETLMLMQGWERRRKALASQSKQHLPVLIMLAGGTLSAMWLTAAVVYVHNTVGWQNVATLMPHEIGGFLAGLLAPMALFWMVLTFWLRSVDVKLYAEALRHEIQAMIFPSDEAEKRVNNDIDRLMRQTAEMSRATRNALIALYKARQAVQGETQAMQSGVEQTADRLEALEKRLSLRNDALHVLQKNLDEKSRLLEGVSEKLVQDAVALDTTTQKTAHTSQMIGDVLQAPLADLKQWQHDVVQALKDSMARIAEQQHDLRVDIDDIEDKATHVASILQKGTSRIYDFTDDALDKAKLIETRLQGQGLALEQILAQIHTQSHILGERHQAIMQDLQNHSQDGQQALFNNAQLIEKLLGQMSHARDALKNGMSDVSDAATYSTDHVTETMNKLQAQLEQAADALQKTMQSTSTDSVAHITESLVDLKASLAQTAQNARETIQHETVISADHIAQSMQNLKQALEQSASQTVSGLNQTAQHVQENVAGTTKEALTQILSSMQDLQSKMEQSAEKTQRTISDTTAVSTDHVVQTMGTLQTTLQEVATTSTGLVHDAAQKAQLVISEHMQQAMERLVQVFTRVKDGIGTMTNSSVDQLAETATRLQNEITEAAEKASGATKENLSYLSERTAGYVAEFGALVTQASERAAEQSRALVTQTREALLADHEKSKDTVDDLMMRNARHLSDMADSFVGLRQTIESLVNIVGQRQSDLSHTSEAFVSQADQVRGILDQTFARVTDAANDLNRQVISFATVIAQPIDRLEDVSHKAQEKLQITGNMFDQKVSAVQDLGLALQNSAKEIGNEMNKHADTLRNAVTDIQTDIHVIKQDLSVQTDTLDHRVKSMLNQVTLVLPQMDRVSDQLVSLNTETDKTYGQLKQLDETLQSHTQNVVMVSEDTVNRVQESLARYAALGERYEEISVSGLDALAGAQHVYEKNVSLLSAGVDEARQKFDQVNQSYETLAGTISTLDERIVAGYDKAEKASAAMAEIQDKLSSTALAIDTHTQDNVTSMKSLHQTLEEAYDAFVQRAGVLKDLAHESEAQAHNLSIRTQEINDVTQTNTDMLEKATSILRDTIAQKSMQTEQVELFNTQITTLNDRMLEQRQIIREQAEVLEKAAQEAVDKAAHIRDLEQSLQRDHFFSAAKFVVESLHSLALDFTRMLDGELPEKTWKAYQRGDTSVFAKRLVSARDQISHDKLRRKYEEDTEFRTYVQRYFRQFEEMYEQAKTHDHGDLLSSVFVSSDVGRLYQFLQDTLKKN